ncbi:helix-turn-helix transcriptional regulator [Martelella sp. HB161492]|uniref:ArsR/SmtB family transcription factor n=1 Tax=Martelella sp. HB161492 TaxID=2720726 RepID=UPI00159159A3|nr:helix-turn-helix transcriptional regulator [Martelella sp. HB161492]
MINQISGNALASVAALIGDVARANILSALMGGKALTAGELASLADVTPQTASSHLAKLVDGHLVSVEKQGRHRYFRLASADIAELIETLSAVAATGPRRHRPTGPKDLAMRKARTCYDHMAGSIAVALADRLIDSGDLVIADGAGMLTDQGRATFHCFGIDVDDARQSRRALCRTCLDWSERRHHLGGWLGASILSRSLELGFVRRLESGRTLVLTRKGQAGFGKAFGLSGKVLDLDAG